MAPELRQVRPVADKAGVELAFDAVPGREQDDEPKSSCQRPACFLARAAEVASLHR